MSATDVRIVRGEDAIRVAWNQGTEVVFALENGRVLGIRGVTQGGVALRNPAKLWRPRIITPSGVWFSEFTLIGVRETGSGGVMVEVDAVGSRTGIREEQDEYLGDVLELSQEDKPLHARFMWRLEPSRLVLGDQTFDGFSYSYCYESADRSLRIYRIFDEATWEIAGRVDGNTLLLQGQVNPPVTDLGRCGFFTTACNYYGAELKGVMGAVERVSFQRLPRMGTLQAFDFLAHAEGILFGYFDPTVEVMSILQKNEGEDVLHVVDELRQPLSDRFESYPKHIVFCPSRQPRTREDQRNLWARAYDFVHDRERARCGIAPSSVLPRVWTPQIGGDQFYIGAKRGPRERTYYHLADEVLPQWADMGVKEICTPSLWVSDYTVDRMKCKNDTGMHGELVVSGICCVRVHEIDPLYGGTDALAYFVDRAHRLGMTVQLWWASHLSRRAPIYTERPDFMLIARDGLPNGGGYGHKVIITMNLANPDCLEWEFGKLKAVYEATGVDGLFHDSYGNMTFLPVNYADPLRRGQQEAYSRLVSRLQKLGMKTFTVEGLGPWGIGHFGMGLLPTAPSRRHHYQNALDWWLDHADMVYRLNMGIFAGVWPGQEREAWEFSFRCLAGGGRFGFTQHRDGVELWDGWIRDQNRLYGRVAPLTGRRILLPGDSGVLWETRPGERLLFTFKECTVPLCGQATVTRVTADGEQAVGVSGGSLQAEPWCVYRISDGSGGNP